MLLAGSISHTSTQYIDFVNFLRFHWICHSISECCVMFSGVKLSMGSFVLLLPSTGDWAPEA